LAAGITISQRIRADYAMKRNVVDARVKCEQEKVQHTMRTLSISKSRLKRAVKDNRMSLMEERMGPAGYVNDKDKFME